MNKVDQQRDHFEKVSHTYLQARQHENHLMLKHLLWEFFFSNKKDLLKNGGAVLEPMCGYSEGKKIVEAFCTPNVLYTGFDFSRPLVDEARTRYPGLDITVQDATQYVPTKEYDLIILIGGLHHVYSYTEGVLERLSKALRPGGYMINFEPTQDNFIFRRIRERIYKKNEIFDEETEQAYDLSELNRFYHKANLEIVDQIYPGLLSYVLYYNPDAFPSLNLGGVRMVRFLFGLEKHFYRSWPARKLSFATMSLLRKPS